ncbi:hypothetical protein ACG33_14750 [Steroidobacter denitrificans]|uniref:YqjK-like protein n=1 Tax=Steroidobacter denitrificans TaxID=465721 RepID=A0A127FEJ8_STEDE|nr:YqjK family protein [Steroidobacter denitrificans]AMN48331.1 hypothetical protein ACG33_14750 [Steroidobacter denitrificans]
MSERFDQLMAQHQELLARSDAQRRQMSAMSRQLERQLAGVDRAIDKIRALARSPLLIAGGLAVIALIGPRRLWRLGGRGAMFYTTASRFLRLGRRKEN